MQLASIKSRLTSSHLQLLAIESLQPISAVAFTQTRSFRAFTPPLLKDPESKAEKTANLIKENILDLKKDDQQQQKTTAKLGSDEAKSKASHLSSGANLEQPVAASASAIEDKLSSDRKSDIQQPQQSQQLPQQTSGPVVVEQVVKAVERPTLWQRIVKELKHYSDGFKLLYFETKITYGLLKKVLRGETLTRRERRQVKP